MYVMQMRQHTSGLNVVGLNRCGCNELVRGKNRGSDKLSVQSK